MNSLRARAVVSFVVPAGIVLLVAALVLQFGWLPLSGRMLDLTSYGVFGLAALLGWRFRSSRLVVAAAALAVAQRGLMQYGPADPNLAGLAIVVSSVLLPIDFLVLSFLPERGFRAPIVIFWAVLLALEAGAVAGVCGADDRNFQNLFAAHLVSFAGVPPLALWLFAATLIVLVVRYAMRQRPVEAGLFWSLAAALLAFRAGATGMLAAAYFAAGGLVLVLALVESSHFMAYHDELTGLPARRALNDALAATEGQFCVAVVDVDHFKKFNDTYGHEVGDQVLRMVASRLARVTGGGHSFRAGGEEFCVVFRDCTVRDVLPHLDLLRETIESSSFIVRGDDRVSRTAEDRRSRKSAGDVEVSVTVSIGTAQATPQLAAVGDVLQAADEALYHAKDAGRNRVEVYRPPRRRGSAVAVESL
jgi:diguanylate cyclase (GGDEF)-like protein